MLIKENNTQQHEEMSSFLVEEMQVLNTTINENEDKLGQMETKIKELEDVMKELLAMKILVGENKAMIETNRKVSEETKVLKSIIYENKGKMNQMEAKIQDYKTRGTPTLAPPLFECDFCWKMILSMIN